MFKLLTFISLAASQIHVTTSQCLGRQPPNLNYNRQIPELIMESPENCNCQNPVQLQSTVIESPTIPNNLPVTLITDCTPSVCKNLANTIQLMIVVNLLKNAKGSDMAVELAMPLLNEIISSPSFTCGCSNPLFSKPVAPNIGNPNIISPKLFPNFISNSFYPNVISSNFMSGMNPGIPPNYATTNIKNVVF